MKNDGNLLSIKALQWLRSINYQDMDHEFRMKAIKFAKENFPDDDLDDPRDQFFATLNLASQMIQH